MQLLVLLIVGVIALLIIVASSIGNLVVVELSSQEGTTVSTTPSFLDHNKYKLVHDHITSVRVLIRDRTPPKLVCSDDRRGYNTSSIDTADDPFLVSCANTVATDSILNGLLNNNETHGLVALECDIGPWCEKTTPSCPWVFQKYIDPIGCLTPCTDSGVQCLCYRTMQTYEPLDYSKATSTYMWPSNFRTAVVPTKNNMAGVPNLITCSWPLADGLYRGTCVMSDTSYQVKEENLCKNICTVSWQHGRCSLQTTFSTILEIDFAISYATSLNLSSSTVSVTSTERHMCANHFPDVQSCIKALNTSADGGLLHTFVTNVEPDAKSLLEIWRPAAAVITNPGESCRNHNLTDNQIRIFAVVIMCAALVLAFVVILLATKRKSMPTTTQEPGAQPAGATHSTFSITM